MNTNNKCIDKWWIEHVKFEKDIYYKYWYSLVKYLEPNTNRLVIIKELIDGRLNPQPLSPCDIQYLLSIGESTVSNFLSYCKEHHYIHIVKINGKQVFYINPAYELNGSGITVELYLIFQGTCIEFYVSKESKAMIKDYLGLDHINESKAIS